MLFATNLALLENPFACSNVHTFFWWHQCLRFCLMKRFYFRVHGCLHCGYFDYSCSSPWLPSDCSTEVSCEIGVAVIAAVTEFTGFFNVLANEFVAGLSNIWRGRRFGYAKHPKTQINLKLGVFKIAWRTVTRRRRVTYLFGCIGKLPSWMHSPSTLAVDLRGLEVLSRYQLYDSVFSQQYPSVGGHKGKLSDDESLPPLELILKLWILHSYRFGVVWFSGRIGFQPLPWIFEKHL